MQTMQLDSFPLTLPEGILIVTEYGTITYYDPMALEVLSLNSMEMQNRKFSDLFYSVGFLKSFFASGDNIYGQALAFNEKQIAISMIHITPRNHKDRQAICVLKDVRQLHEIMEQVNRCEIVNLQLETIINSSTDEIFVTDGNGKVLRVNPAGEAFYGVKAESLIGRYSNELGEEGLYSPVMYPLIMERKEKVSMIQRTRANKTIHVIGNPVFDKEGNISLIIFTSRDLTEIRHLKEKIERTQVLLESYKSEVEELNHFQDQNVEIVAFSPNMRKLLRLASKIAAVDSTILITGESGVGKGVIANSIHQQSGSRKEKAFVPINCGAIPETLIESELFGYEGGAFTGARKQGKEGLLEQAHGGTVFLDEIGELPLHLQVKLLKAIQDKKIMRVGGSKMINIDVRIIAATNRDLGKLVKEGGFREDLYYRLNVIPIHIPPLRTRIEDISYLIDFFIKRFNDKYQLSNQLSLEAENTLIGYSWPGNVRELENIIERLVVTAESNQITLHDLPEYILKNESVEHSFLSDSAENSVRVTKLCTLKQAQEEMEEQLIRKAYELHKSSYKVADILGINQSTAIRKIQKFIKKN